MRRRFFPLLLVILAHVILLHWISNVSFTPPYSTESTEIVPVAIILDKEPVVTKFIATNSVEKFKHQKPLPLATSSHPTFTKQITDLAQQPIPLPVPAAPPPSPEPVINDETALLAMPPPSARYILDVVRTEPKLANPYRGTGEMVWNHDNHNYTLQMDVGIDVLFTKMRLYDLKSEGSIAEWGIKPNKMEETRHNKSTTTTQFNYESHTINYSNNVPASPMTVGAQDKITVLMQLASIGNADATQFEPGEIITIQVAEEKEAHLHQFVVSGQETINTHLGRLNTWHIVRPPHPGFYSSRIDIWLAPELNWLPVQIQNTEANGAITTQTIRQIIEY